MNLLQNKFELCCSSTHRQVDVCIDHRRCVCLHNLIQFDVNTCVYLHNHFLHIAKIYKSVHNLTDFIQCNLSSYSSLYLLTFKILFYLDTSVKTVYLCILILKHLLYQRSSSEDKMEIKLKCQRYHRKGTLKKKKVNIRESKIHLVCFEEHVHSFLVSFRILSNQYEQENT